LALRAAAPRAGEEVGKVLVELTVVEQRYDAVKEVIAQGLTVTEVAARYKVSRQTVHEWLARYRAGGLRALADRSHRPKSCPHQMDPETQARVLDLRRAHPGWGPVRLRYALERQGNEPVPGRSSIYRALVRAGLVEPRPRGRKKHWRRWERANAMELWQMDVMGARLADGTWFKVITGLDDHSRFCVIARAVPKATATATCEAFAEAMRRYGVPEAVLTDNGKVFTARFGPHRGQVLFDRICHENGIRHLLTSPRSPTTTGKIERFHKSLRTELLADESPATLEEAQGALDRWVEHYNALRPHQALGMATPAERFRVGTSLQPPVDEPELPSPVERLRLVSGRGLISFATSRYNVGRAYAGEMVTVRAEADLVRVFLDGKLIKVYARKHPAEKEEVIYRHHTRRNPLRGVSTVSRS
jgi:transposase InsO family protein